MATPPRIVEDWTLQKVLSTVPQPVTSAATSPVAFLHIIQRLKTTAREGWKHFGIINGESVADHMYRMGIICMLVPPTAGIDRDRCVKMALVHDMAEALVGDLTPMDRVDKDVKFQHELDAMRHICDELLAPMSPVIAEEFLELWEEYEAGVTAESVFVKDVDRFELVCQTIEYEKQHDGMKDLSEFMHVRKGIQTDLVKGWLQDAVLEREAFWKGKGVEKKLD